MYSLIGIKKSNEVFYLWMSVYIKIFTHRKLNWFYEIFIEINCDKVWGLLVKHIKVYSHLIFYGTSFDVTPFMSWLCKIILI